MKHRGRMLQRMMLSKSGRVDWSLVLFVKCRLSGALELHKQCYATFEALAHVCSDFPS